MHCPKGTPRNPDTRNPLQANADRLSVCWDTGRGGGLEGVFCMPLRDLFWGYPGHQPGLVINGFGQIFFW